MTEEEPPGLAKSWPRRPARLAAAVVEDLADLIVGGTYAPGHALPVEAVLIEQYGMSRTTIREAIKLLEAKGLVRARQGYGTTVTDPDSWDLLDQVVLGATVRHDRELRVLDELVDVRRALESQMAAQAAERATDDDVRAICQVYDQLTRDLTEPARFVNTDVEFHERIMVASGNRLARAIVRTVHAEPLKSEKYTGVPTVEGCAAANAGHGEIVRCIKAGDRDGAATAMSRHILDGWRRRRPSRVEPVAAR